MQNILYNAFSPVTGSRLKANYGDDKMDNKSVGLSTIKIMTVKLSGNLFTLYPFLTLIFKKSLLNPYFIVILLF